MKRCEVISYFTLKKFNELENIVRANENNNAKNGELFAGDTFDCDEKMADYLMGNNDRGMIVVKIVEELEQNEEEQDEMDNSDEVALSEATQEEKSKEKIGKKKKISKK
jgi:hypothetical protein